MHDPERAVAILQHPVHRVRGKAERVARFFPVLAVFARTWIEQHQTNGGRIADQGDLTTVQQHQIPDAHSGQAVGIVRVVFEMAEPAALAVAANQAVFAGGEPEVSVSVLDDGLDGVVGQALGVFRVVGEPRKASGLRVEAI